MVLNFEVRPLIGRKPSLAFEHDLQGIFIFNAGEICLRRCDVTR